MEESTTSPGKRPITAFIRFRREMKEKHKITNQSLQRRIWKELPCPLKQKYFDEYQIDLDKYRRGPRATRRHRATEPSSTLTWIHENPMETNNNVSTPLSTSPYKPILPKLNTFSYEHQQPIQLVYPLNPVYNEYPVQEIPTISTQQISWDSLFLPFLDTLDFHQ
jgi:hypothetical protein